MSDGGRTVVGCVMLSDIRIVRNGAWCSSIFRQHQVKMERGEGGRGGSGLSLQLDVC